MPSDSLTNRRLAAIIFADIVGYTAMMQSDETLAVTRLQRYREVLQNTVLKYEGEIIKSYGDGSLCVFNSVLSAVKCAMEVQELLAKGILVPLRIGVHIGDVMYREDDIYGDALNIAARIESMGVAGSVLVSSDVFKRVKNQVELNFTSLGNFALKNVEDPVEVFAIANDGLVVPTANQIGGKVTSIPSAKQSNRRLLWIAGSLVLVALFIIMGTYYFQANYNDTVERKTERGAVAVFDFENNTLDPEFDLLGKMVSNRIIHGISENDIAKVITNETINDYNRIGRATLSPKSQNRFLNSRFGVKEIIHGNIYKEGNTLLFDCVLTNAETEEVIKGLKTIRCSIDSPMEGIEELKQTILGFLALSKDLQLNLSLETSPPKYDAYKELMLANEESLIDDLQKLVHLNRAIEIDSSYFEPKVLRLSSHYNLGNYATADSLLRLIDINREHTDKRQLNLLNFYHALLQGKNDLSFKYFNKEYELSPFHLSSNMTNMVLAVQFINRLDLAEDFFSIIPSESLDIANCTHCQYRIYVKIYMDIENGQYENAIRLAEQLNKSSGPDLAGGLLKRALVKSGKWADLDKFIENYKIEDPNIDMLPIYTAAAKECVLMNNKEKASKYLNAAKNVISENANQGQVGDVLYMNGEIEKSKLVFEELLRTSPENPKALSYLSGLYLLENNNDRASEMFGRLDDQRAPYQYGEIDYWIARGYIIGGNEKEALRKLESSVAQGYRYGFYDYQNDFIFTSIKNKSEFLNVMTYWQ